MGPRTRRSRRPLAAAALSALLVPIAAVAADTRAEQRTATEQAREPEPVARVSGDVRAAARRGRRALLLALRRGRGRVVCPGAARIRCQSGLGLRTLLVDTVMRRAETARRRLAEWGAWEGSAPAFAAPFPGGLGAAVGPGPASYGRPAV